MESLIIGPQIFIDRNEIFYQEESVIFRDQTFKALKG